jgi:anti-anti-sigma regulatory factor
MTLRIETIQGHRYTTIRLIGRIRAEHLSELKVQLDAAGPDVVLDLGEVSIVNLDVVRFLGECDLREIRLLNCPAYIRKWIDQEKVTGPKS